MAHVSFVLQMHKHVLANTLHFTTPFNSMSNLALGGSASTPPRGSTHLALRLSS